MGSRLKTFTIRKWIAGLNTSTDESLLNPDELSIATNVVFNPSGSKKNRGGMTPYNYVAVGVNRASSGTTRTITVTVNSGITINANDYIMVWSNGSYNSNYQYTRVQVATINTSGGNKVITYTMPSNHTETTTADTDLRVSLYLSSSIIGMKDFWYLSSGVKTQKRVIVTSAGTFYQIAAGGSMTPITDGGTALTGTLTGADFAVLNDKLVMSFSGTGNKPKIWTGTGSIADLKNLNYAGTDVTATTGVVDFEFMRVWQGRLWTNDKANPDKIHYSDIEEPERMLGEGDSGAALIDPGDDDISGITAIFPPIKGRLAFAKQNKLFQVVGEPPLFRVEKISEGIGCATHHSVSALDQDDVVFISRKGIHSFAASSEFGDFSGKFLSNKIQESFNHLDLSVLNKTRSVYVPNINSILFSARESGTSNDIVYIYSVIPDAPPAWYKWTSENSNLNFVSFELFSDSNVKNLYVGTSGGLVLKYDEDVPYDLVRENILTIIKTGLIYTDDNIATFKGYKKLYLLYKVEREEISFRVSFKIDNHDSQNITVVRSPDSDLLGSTFTLGTSLLGSVKILIPDPIEVGGYGHGCSIKLESDSTNIEYYGYTVEWEPMGDSPERSS